MWLTKGNLYTRVERASEAEVAWLRSKESGLAFGNKRARYSGAEPEVLRFFDLEDRRFPAGFTPLVVERAEAAGHRVELLEGRARPAAPVHDPATDASAIEAAVRLGGYGHLRWLRDYQLRAVQEVLRAERGIVKMATGSGKSELAIALALSVPVKWIFLVHRASLMEQAAQRFELRCPGETAGRIGAGLWQPRHRFTVATFQTLSVALKDKTYQKGVLAFLAGIQGLLVDECHTLPAKSFWEVAMALTNAYWRVGLSATPLDREDQRSAYAVAALGPQIVEVSAQELIAKGVLAKPHIRLVPVRQEFPKEDEDGGPLTWTWPQVYEEGVVRSKPRNLALLAATARAAKPCLVFVKSIQHGRAFTRALKARGVKADFVWGTASLQARQSAVKRLVRGDDEVLVSSVIFQEGVDIPELRSVVVAAGEKAVIAALQRIGRGMRLAEGKTSFEVWDVQDTGQEWLERHSKRRRRAYQREGYSVSVAQVAPSAPPPASRGQGELPLRGAT